MVGSCYVYILRFNIATVTGCRIMYLPRIMATIGLFSTASQFMAIRNVARQGPAHALPPESQQASATIHVGQEAISEAEQATEASNLTAWCGTSKVIWDELQIGRHEDSMDIIRTRFPRWGVLNRTFVWHAVTAWKVIVWHRHRVLLDFKRKIERKYMKESWS